MIPSPAKQASVIGFGAVYRQDAASLNPLCPIFFRHFKARRAHADVGGIVHQRMGAEVVQRLWIAKAR
ncbi:Uncharacterised protein [Kluyvera cryocrescens]|uniref:Uncharacterized protein n=1 Tax=Kluyvera cryocrescens TaxID=580 RepID=A0A485AN64_KLUCR|nr:Uncharacterised protein [Kluyvera cryocrescens]